jgi:hypothetical protein
VPVIEPVAIVAEIDELSNEVNQLDLEKENHNNLPAKFWLNVDNDDDSVNIDEMLWSTKGIFQSSWVQSVMSGNRYSWISRNLRSLSKYSRHDRCGKIG